MAEDLALGTGVRRPEERPQPAELVPPQPRQAYGRRFLLAYLALAVLMGVAGGAAFVLFSGDRAPGEGWSDWRPVGEESSYPAQIADHVARRYVLPSGDQLVGILAGPAEVQDVKVRAVAIEAPGADSAEDIAVIPTEDSVMYVLCGLGENCSIRDGELTDERRRLLRREALEAALYTFTYLEDVESVIVLLPPPAEAEAVGSALFLERKHLETALELPLAETVSRPQLDAPVAAVPEGESVLVDRFTTPHLYSYQFQQLQDGEALMVLAPARG